MLPSQWRRMSFLQWIVFCVFLQQGFGRGRPFVAVWQNETLEKESIAHVMCIGKYGNITAQKEIHLAQKNLWPCGPNDQSCRDHCMNCASYVKHSEGCAMFEERDESLIYFLESVACMPFCAWEIHAFCEAWDGKYQEFWNIVTFPNKENKPDTFEVSLWDIRYMASEVFHINGMGGPVLLDSLNDVTLLRLDHYPFSDTTDTEASMVALTIEPWHTFGVRNVTMINGLPYASHLIGNFSEAPSQFSIIYLNSITQTYWVLDPSGNKIWKMRFPEMTVGEILCSCSDIQYIFDWQGSINYVRQDFKNGNVLVGSLAESGKCGDESIISDSWKNSQFLQALHFREEEVLLVVMDSGFYYLLLDLNEVLFVNSEKDPRFFRALTTHTVSGTSQLCN